MKIEASSGIDKKLKIIIPANTKTVPAKRKLAGFLPLILKMRVKTKPKDRTSMFVISNNSYLVSKIK